MFSRAFRSSLIINLGSDTNYKVRDGVFYVKPALRPIHLSRNWRPLRGSFIEYFEKTSISIATGTGIAGKGLQLFNQRFCKALKRQGILFQVMKLCRKHIICINDKYLRNTFWDLLLKTICSYQLKLIIPWRINVQLFKVNNFSN